MAFQDAEIMSITQVSSDCKQFTITLDDGTFEGVPGDHTALQTPNGTNPYSVLSVTDSQIGLMLRAYGTDGVADSCMPERLETLSASTPDCWAT